MAHIPAAPDLRRMKARRLSMLAKAALRLARRGDDDVLQRGALRPAPEIQG
jgi:hypothetical protein